MLATLWDGFRNFVSGVGTPKDKATWWTWTYRPYSKEEIEAAYLSDWLAKKIVNIIPQDMTREWRTWQHEKAEDLYATEKQFFVRSKVKQALIWARLYGGSAIYISDGSPDPLQPLDVSKFPKDGLKQLHVFNRYDLSAKEYVKDLNDSNYGKPEVYRLLVHGADNVLIHRSRLVIFCGEARPCINFDPEGEWGQSIYDTVTSSIKNAQATSANMAALTEEAKLDIIKIPNLGQYLSQADTTRQLVERFTLANQLKSTVNTLLLGAEEEFDRKQINFAGIPEVLNGHLLLVSGAADVPLTRLFGQSPAGLNATGESDIRNYYDKLRSHQNVELREDLDPLDEILIRHTLGDRPLEVAYEWNSLWQLSQTEIADIFQKVMAALTSLNNLALFMPEELRPAIYDLLLAWNLLPTLDQHIKKEGDPDLEEFLNPPEPQIGVNLNDPNADPAAVVPFQQAAE